MNVSPEVPGWVRKAENDLAAARQLADGDCPLPDQVIEGLTEFAVIFRYPDEWSDKAAAMQSLSKAGQVRALVQQRLGLAGENTR